MIVLGKSAFFQIAKKYISPIFVIITLCFWAYYIVKYSGNLAKIIENIDWFWFCMAMIIFLPFYAIEIFNWQLIIRSLKEKISFFNAGKSWLISNLAKYIPGTIWIPLSRGYITKEENIPYLKSIVAWVFELYFHIASCVLIFCAYLIITTNDESQKIMLGIFCILAIVIPFLKNYIFEVIRMIIQKISVLKSHLIKFEEVISLSKSVPARIPLLLFFTTFLIWILQGIWLYILTYAVIGKVYVLYHFIYIWSFSWFIGFIVIFSPGGFGVREGVMVTLLTKLGIAVPSAIVIALLSRFQYLLLDGIVTLIFMRYFKNRKS